MSRKSRWLITSKQAIEVKMDKRNIDFIFIAETHP